MIKDTDRKLQEAFQGLLEELAQEYNIPLEVLESVSVDLSKRIFEGLRLCLLTNRDLFLPSEGLF